MTEQRIAREREDQLIDWVLGEVSGEEFAGLQSDAVSDVVSDVDPEADFSARTAELRGLFDDLRGLTVEPSSRVGVVVRHTVDRRARLRAGAPPWRPMASLVYGLEVAAVAAVVVGAALLTDRFVGRRPAANAKDARFAGSPVIVDPVTKSSVVDRVLPTPPEIPRHPMHLPPVIRDKVEYPYKLFRMNSDASHLPAFAHVEETRPQDVWLCATNAVASMQLEFTQRFSSSARRRAIHAAGGSTFLAARIETLADELAAKIGVAIEGSTASVQDVALSLRALMAGGSTRRIGDHQARVRQCTDWLIARLPGLHGGALASALSGLFDVALVSGPKMGRLVGEHASRLAESIIYSSNDHRPSMLNWQTEPAQLADAGQVLRLAPAFGTVNKEALLARTYLATHVSERIDRARAECPDLLAANLYGFGDLIDRRQTERRLGLWHARDLVPQHYVALLHVAWSRFPLRSGWADFQLELRSVSTLPTPSGCSDTAALLLALATNYAAPGSREISDLAMR